MIGPLRDVVCRMSLMLLVATAMACASSGAANLAPAEAPTPRRPVPAPSADSEEWTLIERPALLGVQRLLAHDMDLDAVLLARARLTDPRLTAPERMWLYIYEGIGLDRMGRRDKALEAYGRARDLNPHPVAVQGIEAPVRNLRHISDFEARHGAPAASSRPNQALYVARMEADRARYGSETFGRIEELYQVSNRERNTPVARAALQEVLSHYPESNRAGCGALYLAQWEPEATRADRLRAVIEQHADAIYGDGVQVGAYATFQLAELTDSAAERDRLLADLRQRWPDAVDHDGHALAARVASH